MGVIPEIDEGGMGMRKPPFWAAGIQ